MAKPLLTDDLWRRIEPHLPQEPPKPKGGRPRVPDRACLTGILFILRSGTGWEYLPAEMNCGSGMTCWRRLRDWQAAGVWQRIWLSFLHALGRGDRIQWQAVAVDASSTRAIFGGPPLDRTPRIAGKTAPNAT